MTTPRRKQRPVADAQSLRLRAAWMYYGHGMTQQDIAGQLGVGRSTVIKLLEEARVRHEVRFWIDEDEQTCTRLAVELELRFGLQEAIVVPGTDGADATAHAVGLALGRFLSEGIANNSTIGVGWGRTLTASLESFRPPPRTGTRVISLLGGTVDTLAANPVEYAWRLASTLGGDCSLFPAPAVVDSTETKRRLIEGCGLGRLYDLAQNLDVAVVSVGDIGPECSSLSKELISQSVLGELVAQGCVADVMCNFLDAAGGSVDHPINDRILSVGLDAVKSAGHRIIATGGAKRARAIHAAIQRVGCDTLVTDESAAEALVALANDGAT